MSNEGDNQLPDSPDDQKIAPHQHEISIKEAVRIELPPAPIESNLLRFWAWLGEFVKSNVTAAIITGIASALIIPIVQKRGKNKDLQITEYRRGLEAITRAYELAGNMQQASEDLIDLKSGELDPAQFEEPKLILAQRRQIRQNYNEADKHWRQDNIKISWLITISFPDDRDVAGVWKQVQDSITNYNDCAYSWYGRSQRKESQDAIKNACREEKNSVVITMDQFNAKIVAYSKAQRD